MVLPKEDFPQETRQQRTFTELKLYSMLHVLVCHNSSLSNKEDYLCTYPFCMLSNKTRLMT